MTSTLIRTLKTAALAAGLTFGAVSAQAGVVIDNTVVGSTVNTFDPGATGSVLGFITQTGATYGERFSGQTLSTGTGFDVLTGLPSGPLTLLSNAVADSNIGLLLFSGGNVIYGDLSATIGEGAISILFGSGISELGFDVVGTDGGTITVDFFDASGALIGSTTQGAADGYFGFRTTAGSIIAGASITNTDPAGIGFDNVQFDAASAVPEPSTLALVGIALLGVAGARRRKSA